MTDSVVPKPIVVYYRGVLSVLRNVTQYDKHRFHADQLKATKLVLRSRSKKRHHRDGLEQQQQVEKLPERLASLQDILSSTECTILFFFHPRQPHSLQLRSILSDFCEKYCQKIVCLAIFGGDPKSLQGNDQEDVNLFCQGTGFVQIVTSDEPGQNTCSSLLHLLDVTYIPSIIVVPNSTGRPIVGQETALLWNSSNEQSTELMLQRWKEGNSGLSIPQSILAKTLGDSSSVCSIM